MNKKYSLFLTTSLCTRMLLTMAMEQEPQQKELKIFRSHHQPSCFEKAKLALFGICIALGCSTRRPPVWGQKKEN